MTELEQLIAPSSPEAFVRDHWNRSSLHLRGAAGRFPFDQVLAGWRTGAHLTNLRAATIDPQGVQVEERLEPTNLEARFRAGFTICADVSDHPDVKPFVAGVVQELRVMGGPGFAKLYASTDDRGFALHVDAFHVFVVQLEGRKRWRFGRTPAVPSSLFGGSLDAQGRPVFTAPGSGPMFARPGEPVTPPSPDALEERVLEPGDVLYLPPGTWHVARAIEHSVAISISPPRAPIGKLLLGLLEDALLEHPSFREDVVAPPGERGPPGRIEPSLEALFAARVRELSTLLAGFDQRALHRAFRLNLGAEVMAAPQPAEVTPRTRLAHPPSRPFEYLVAPTPEGLAVVLHRDGVEFALPLEAEPFVKGVAASPSFAASDASRFVTPPLSWNDTKALLEQFVAAGLLVPERSRAESD